MSNMTPFNPLDSDIQWDIRRAIEASKGYSGIFGTNSSFEAYLFALAVKRSGGSQLLGTGCSEKEVEDLLDSAQGPVFLFLVDRIARDCGVSLVRRLKNKQPELKAMLLVDSQENRLRTQELQEVYDGLAAAESIGRGGIFRCIEAVTSRKRYLDPLLQEMKGSSEQLLWSDLSQREREIMPLLAKGMKNREIASNLFIAETTARDYVSSILSKLQVRNRAAAVAWAVGHGFLNR